MKSLLLIIVTIFVLAVETFGHDTNKVVCYYGSWAKYRQGNGNCEEETIDPNLCTHLIYTFVGLNGEDGSVKVLDAWADLPASEPGGGRDGYGKFNALKKINPELKTLIAIGGWNEGETAKYSNVLNDPNLRSNFVKSALELVLKYGFDGFDVDWEYPNQRGSEGKESDKEAFIATLKELHEAFQPHGLLISAAVAAAKTSASKSYIIPEMNSYLDLINLMAYDLHGAWESHTGIVAPLYPRADESGEDREVLNVEACVNYWLENGADPKKLVLGIPLYGRSFQLVDKNNYKPGSPSVVNGQGLQGPYTRTAGTLGYNEILELNQNEWDHYWDDEGKVPYMVRGQDWVGYDNEKSVGLKAQYAIDRGLGGVMVWSVETDDLTGISGQKFVLLNSINSVLNGGSVPTTSSTTTGVPTDPSETTEKPSSPPTDPTDPTKPTETTTDKPSTPPSTDICQHEGFVRDKNDCSVFYECIKEQNGELKPTRFQCGAGTYFNEETLVCDYKENVKCNVLL